VSAADLFQVMRPDGTAEANLEPEVNDETLRKFYATMFLSRALDARMLSLQRQGRIGFYVPAVGQEAAQVGAASALEKEDWVFPAYREPAAALWRGFPLRKLVSQFFGNADDLSKGRQMPNHYANRDVNYMSVSSPVGTQIPLAVGAAWAMRMRNERSVTLVFFGDGATSEGDFHVGMNFAGVFKAPTVFFCQNNGWAISIPVHRQTASETIHVKAEAYGFEGVRVDGNDVLATHVVTANAVRHARAGNGPTLIEAVTYRMGPHSSSDDPKRYRSEADVEAWKEKDPIERFRRYLETRGIWTLGWQEDLAKRVDDQISEAVKHAESIPPPPLEDLFTDVFAEMPPHLREQMDELLKSGERRRPGDSDAFPL